MLLPEDERRREIETEGAESEMRDAGTIDRGSEREESAGGEKRKIKRRLRDNGNEEEEEEAVGEARWKGNNAVTRKRAEGGRLRRERERVE